MKYLEERKDLCRIAKSVYDRQLTNAVGGNFSIQVAEKEFLVSATGMSVHKLWDMQPEDVLLIDDQAHILEGNGKLICISNFISAIRESRQSCMPIPKT